jgi:hypothetical protein
MVEVEVRVDDRAHVTELRPRPQDRPPLRIERRRRVDHPRVDEDRALVTFDRPAEDGPLRTLDGDVADVQRTDVQSTKAGSNAAARRSARA